MTDLSPETLAFEERLRLLHEVGNELSRSGSVELLCRRVVELGRERLGFDRLSIWFVDKDPAFLVGSFGVNEKGELRYELGERIALNDDPMVARMHVNKAHSVLDANVPLRDNKGNAMGRGSHAIAAIWNGREIIGFIFMDNLLRKQPLTERDRELLELYASTFGHLYSLKKTEEALARAYAELKESQTQCIQAEKMEVVGRLASGVAHEVKNPLGIIMQGVNYLEKTIPSKNEEITETLDTIKANIRRANQIIASLLDFSKATSVDLRPEDANAILEDAMLLVRFRFKYGPIAIVSEMKKDLPRILADRNKMEQVFVNVMLNAAQAMPEGGRLIIRSYSKHLGEAENGIQIKNGGPFAVGEKAVIIEIEDTGKGISQEDIRKIFDPFFTTKGPTGGAGLGLPVTRSILSIHRGLINVESRESKGTKVTIILKVSEGA